MRPIRYRRNFGLTRRDEDFTGENLRPVPAPTPPPGRFSQLSRSTRGLKELPSRVTHTIDSKVNASPAASILTAVIMGFLIGKLLTN